MVITHRIISIILMILWGKMEFLNVSALLTLRCIDAATHGETLCPQLASPQLATHTHAHMGALSLTLSVALTLSFERKLNNYPAGAERAQGNPLGRVNAVFARVKEAVSGRRAV